LALVAALLINSESLNPQIFDLVVQVFGGKPGNYPPAILPLLLELAALLIFATVSAIVSYQLGRTARIVLFIQLFVLSILCQWWLWQWIGLSGHPVQYMISLLAGAAVGVFCRHMQDARIRERNQRVEITMRNRQLMDLKLEIVKQAEIDRRLLAADLHDQVLNDLRTIKDQMDRYFESSDANLAEEIRINLGKAQSEVRDVMDNLCPVTLEYLGLASGIEYCVRRGSERAGFKGKVRNKLKADELSSLSTIEQTLLYRLIQESITNICKHARASNVIVNITREADALIVRITDDGVGMDLANATTNSRGVRYMRQRADLIGATVGWHSGDSGKGTTVEIRMNMQQNGDGENSHS
jgi:signal transduction histidine kinase